MKLKILLDYLFSTGVIAAPIVGVGYLYADQKNISWKDIISFLKQQELIREDKPDEEDAAIQDSVPSLPLPPPSEDDSLVEEDVEEEKKEEEKNTIAEQGESNPDKKTDKDSEAKKSEKKAKKKKEKKPADKKQILEIIDKLITSWKEKEKTEKEKGKKDKITKGISAFETVKKVLETGYEDSVPEKPKQVDSTIQS